MNSSPPIVGRCWSPISRGLSGLILTAMLGGASLDSTLADRLHMDNTKTQFATLLPTPPVIDGVITTDEWQSANGATGNWKITYDANQTNSVRGGVLVYGPDLIDNNDFSCQIYAGYDAEYLYLAVRVTDNALFDDSATAESANGNTWEDDSVEIFVDALNANDATWSTAHPGGQYVITMNNAYREAEAGNPGYGENKAWYARAAVNDTYTGYDVEFRISLSTLANPKMGDILGFTVGVNDDKSGGAVDNTMDRQVIWVGKPHEPITYGNLIIGHKTYSAPEMPQAPIIDGKINASEYAPAIEIPLNPGTGAAQTTAGIDTWPAGTFEANAWVTHDATAVYVAVDVIDSNVVNDTAEPGSEDGTTWEDDSVEIFFDADHDRTTAWGPSVDFEGQYVLTSNGAHRDAEARNPTFGESGDWYGATTLTAKGYQIEFKVNKSALLNPTNGTVMGFNIALNNDNGAGRIAQLSWNGDPHYEFTYGDLTLAPSVPTEIKITGWQHNADGSFTLQWIGGGTLQLASEVKGPWTDVPTASSPYTFSSAEKIQFCRVIRR